MMSKVIRIIVAWLMVAISLLMIFFFSNKNGEESSELSSGTLENIIDIFVEEERVPEVVEKYHTPFRKIAHVGIYMLLGFSLACAFSLSLSINPIFSYAFSFIVGLIYSLIDEFVFQGNSNGRGPSIVDALVFDGLGLLAGILLFGIFLLLYKKFADKNRNLV